MSEKIVQLNEEVIKGQIKDWFAATWRKPLNGLLEEEAKNWHRRQSMNAAKSGRDTAAVITAGI
jgi:hypothetical protein